MNSEALKKWISGIIKSEGYTLSNLNFIFCTDAYLRKLNKEYLNHDYNTDVVTFDNSVSGKNVDGDIFISIERVKANAKTFDVLFKDELHRVMIHGVLHLLGYSDKNKRDTSVMKKMEEKALTKR
jgi:rRNA maturation RNase YbeY